VFKRAGQIGRPCLLGYIGKCSAPCVGTVSAEQHRAIVDDFCDFMAGRTDAFVRRLERDMMQASDELEFEKAARLRDDIAALRKAMEKQTVVLGDGTDADVVAFAEDPLEAAVQVFHVRDGRVRGQRGWVVEKVEDLTTGDLVHHFCTQVYGDQIGEGDVPRELLVPALPPDAEALEAWLSQHRGSRVHLRVPQRGDKRSLLETVARNAGESLTRHKLRRAGDLTTRSKALDEISDALGMDTAPLRIECFDVSHIQGTDVVASMVVFEDGLPRKSEYRRFAVRGNPDGSGVDDLAAMSEVMRRRFARFRAEPGASAPRDTPAAEADSPLATIGSPERDLATNELPEQDLATNELPGVDPLTGRPRRFAYPPQLVVVDGGQPQVNAVAAVLSDLGITDVALCGLAKRLEEVWLPGDDFPVILPRTSEALYLLQRVRDEAHRFAITFHRERRSKRMTASALDTIAGLGETRRKALLKHFGSLKRLSRATPEEITEVPGIGRRTADAVLAALAPEGDRQPALAPESDREPALAPESDREPAPAAGADRQPALAPGALAPEVDRQPASPAAGPGAAPAADPGAAPAGGAGRTRSRAADSRVVLPAPAQVTTSSVRAARTDKQDPGPRALG
jgi:excinuclease ABC subunit C